MGIFNLLFRDKIQSPDPRVARFALIDELDNIVTTISGWATVQHNSDGTHNFAAQGFDLVPVGGTIQWHASIATPTRWLLCDGSNVSRGTYAQLFRAIGITYGAGDGSTTFTLPNLNGGVPKYIILACV
jgi:hypothetical protein